MRREYTRQVNGTVDFRTSHPKFDVFSASPTASQCTPEVLTKKIRVYVKHLFIICKALDLFKVRILPKTQRSLRHSLVFFMHVIRQFCLPDEQILLGVKSHSFVIPSSVSRKLKSIAHDPKARHKHTNTKT